MVSAVAATEQSRSRAPVIMSAGDSQSSAPEATPSIPRPEIGAASGSDAAGSSSAESAERVVNPVTPILVQTHSAAADFAHGEAVDMATFLDRLMMAESSGRADAKNPRSTATGPFQFIEGTFIEVVRRHFHEETARFTDDELLDMRTDRAFSRRAAEAYTRDNARMLAAAGQETTFTNLRLAFLLGPDGAARVLRASTNEKLGNVLPTSVLTANPFMKPMVAGDLIRRAARDLSTGAGGAELGNSVVVPGKVSARAVAGRSFEIARPRIIVRCNTSLPSCRSWIARQERKLMKRATRQARR